jgi:predicted cupin superfamily sugar epimerase
MLTTDEIKHWLELQPNPAEGGLFASTYTASLSIPANLLPGFANPPESRAICSAIYYFLDKTGFSALHRVKSDMLYHFYTGNPVQMLLLYPPGRPNRSEVFVLGNDLANGSLPMKLVPGGTWLGSRLLPGGEYALMGVSMAPGFDPADYQIAKREELLKVYDTASEISLINALTRS